MLGEKTNNKNTYKIYGLSGSERRILFGILFAHKEALNCVRLFGSRARGDYRRASDIDLAITGQNAVFSMLALAFSESPLPYTVDIVNYDDDISGVLRHNIDREGKIIFATKEGKPVVTPEQLKAKLNDYKHALERLNQVLAKDASLDDAYLDATIQRFEFSFELAWKLMKAYLEYDGFATNSPRSSIREGFKTNLLEDATAWLDMLEQRNLAAHTYDEEMAAKLYKRIKEDFYNLLSKFSEEMTKRLTIE